MANILITGGRAPVSLDLARYFHQRGHTVFIAESQTAQLSRNSRAVKHVFNIPGPRFHEGEFINCLEKIILDQKIDLLLPTCEEVFYIARNKQRLAKYTKVLTDDFTKLARLHDKWQFNQWAEQLRLPVPESLLIHSAAELQSLAARAGNWILKPAYSRFGANIFSGTLSEITQARPQLIPSSPWVLQRFIEGPEYCVYAIAEKGQLQGLSIYAHEFIVGKAGICFEEIHKPIIQKHVESFINKIEFTGQIAFDFIESASGEAFALECNPRSTSGIHLLALCEGLDKTLLSENKSLLRAPLGQRSMLGLAMLLFGFQQFGSPKKVLNWFKIFFSSHEVVFSLKDPLPFFDQLICFAQIAIQSRKRKIGILEMSTLDIEWNGAH